MPTAQDHPSPAPRRAPGAPPCPYHSRPWHRGSVFGDGPRRALDPDRRRAWLARVEAERHAGNLPAQQANVAKALLKYLGEDGRCDPAHATLAAASGAGERTVRRALDSLRELGLLRWERRLVRREWPAGGRGASRAEQTSNAYELLLPTGPLVPRARRPVQRRLPLRCDGQTGRETQLNMIHRELPPLSEDERKRLEGIQAARQERLAAEWLAQRAERWRNIAQRKAQ